LKRHDLGRRYYPLYEDLQRNFDALNDELRE